MAFSKIVLDFNRRVEIGEFLQFSWRDLDVNGGATSYLTKEEWASIRFRPGQVEYQLAGNNGEVDALNYITSFNYDFNGGNLFTVTMTGAKQVTVEAKKSNIEFLNPSSTGGVGIVITNEPQVPTFTILSTEDLEANSGPCTNVKVRVECSSDIQDLLQPVEILGVNNTVVEFDYVRGTNFQILVQNAFEQRNTSHTTHPFLANPVINVVNTPTGATASFAPQTNLPSLQYSLDNINWQNSTVFAGLGDGNYTGYVKDTYGCTKQTAFAVDGFTPDVTVSEPYSYVSNTNSIRFKKDELWDNNSIFKNDGNTLSWEERSLLNVPFIHKFTDQDVIPLQFKTNYETAQITLMNCSDNSEDIFVALPVTNNLNKVDVRDAIRHDFEDGIRNGFYFQTGNVYEDDAPVNTIKEEYQLYGSLPAWCKIGNYFSVDFGAYVKITDIVFVESINSNVIVVSESFFGQPTDVILKANYNVFNWDAYEFEIDMSPYLNQEFQIKIELTDSNFDTVTFISEKVQVYADLSDRMHIAASNTENNDVVYQTGIVHYSRTDIDIDGLADESELEIHKADDNVYQLDGYSYDKKKVTLTRLSTMISRQLRQMLTLDTIFINGVKCTIESVESPTRIGITNNYKMDVTYYQVIDKPVTGDLDVDVELDIVDVPALIIGDDEFIKQ